MWFICGINTFLLSSKNVFTICLYIEFNGITTIWLSDWRGCLSIRNVLVRLVNNPQWNAEPPHWPIYLLVWDCGENKNAVQKKLCVGVCVKKKLINNNSECMLLIKHWRKPDEPRWRYYNKHNITFKSNNGTFFSDFFKLC